MATSTAMPHEHDRAENHHAHIDSNGADLLEQHPSTNGIASHQNHVDKHADASNPQPEPVSVSSKLAAASLPASESPVPPSGEPEGDATGPEPRQEMPHTGPASDLPRPADEPEPLPIAVEEPAPGSLRVAETVVHEEPASSATPVESVEPEPIKTTHITLHKTEAEPASAVLTDAPESDVPETPAVETPVVETPVVETPVAVAEPEVVTKVEVQDQVMEDAPPVPEPAPVAETPSTTIKLTREREEDEMEDAPDAKRARTEDEPLSATIVEAGPTSLAQTAQVDTPMSTDTSAMPPPVAPAPVPPPSLEQLNATTVGDQNFGTEMTEIQQKKLVESMRNLKKNKAATPFQNPVDHVALGIPTYPDIIKTPMDLGNMERKLKEKQYPAVHDYISDFNLMIWNCYRFNGVAHVVSVQAGNLKAQFDKQMQNIPKAGQTAAEVQVKKPRRDSIPITTREAPRRTAAPRPAGPASSPTASSSAETFAIRDGVPIPRRQSSSMLDRPKREIHKPPSKDLPYSFKPRKKAQMADLKFAEHVVEEMKSSKHSAFSFPFQEPVDPVAMNLPTYNAIVKKPMDVSTVSEKLRRNEYDSSEQVKADFKLMFKNCEDFNGNNNPVTAMAKKYEDLFDALWKQKKAWLNEHHGGSGPQSPESDEESSEEEEDEEEDEDAMRRDQLAQISAQIAQLSAQAQAIVSGATAKPKGKEKAKATVSTKKTKKAGKEKPVKAKKTSGAVSANSNYPILKPKEKAKPKKQPKKKKPLTEKQKEELSEKVGQLGPEQMTEAARMIKEGFRKAGMHELANQPDDNLEFEINQIPDDTLVDLLAYARRMVPSPSGNTARDSDDEYASPAASRPSGKQRKRKPMAKAEQAAQINALRGQIQQFEAGSASEANSPEGNILQSREQDSSDDDEVSGSESEEE